ncbi:hypothetical protein MRX96_002551 [Rhipicephalus microplus]
MTDEAFEARHQVCEEEEKQRFAGLLSKAVITQSKPSGGSQTPHHRLPYDSMESSMSPPPSGLPCCAPCEVDPYEPRTFPLAQEEYEQMVADSPHLLPSPAASPSHMVTDTSPPPLEPGPLESDTPGSGPLELGPSGSDSRVKSSGTSPSGDSTSRATISRGSTSRAAISRDATSRATTSRDTASRATTS